MGKAPTNDDPVIVPLAFILPITSNFSDGALLLIPTSPPGLMRSLSVGVSLLVPCPMIKLPEPSLSIRLSKPPLGTDSSISGVPSTNCNLSLKVD